MLTVKVLVPPSATSPAAPARVTVVGSSSVTVTLTQLSLPLSVNRLSVEVTVCTTLTCRIPRKSSKSLLTAVTVTSCGVLQVPSVNVSMAGATVTVPLICGASATVTLAVGSAPNRTV